MTRALTLPALIAGLLLLIAAPASAVQLSGASAKPADLTAGAHSNFEVGFAVSDVGAVGAGGDDLRDLDIALPAGLVGDPGAATVCSFAALQGDTCPSTSAVGTTSAVADVQAGILSLPNQAIPGSIYRIPVRGTEAARLGIVLRPNVAGVPLDKVITESPIRVRTATDSGLTAVIRDLPRSQPLAIGSAELRITRLNMTLLKTAGSGKAFMTNPTTCGPATTRITARTYGNASASTTAAFTPTGCGSVPFTPSLEVSADPVGADVPTSASVTVRLPFNRDNPNARAQTQPKQAVVALPVGFELAPTIGSAGDLAGCTDDQFAKASSAPSSCPAGSQIGTVEFSSPLIPAPLQGKVFLAQPIPGAPLIRVFIVAEQGPQGDALRIKLQGNSDVNQDNGQVTTTLNDIPPLPFTSFRLSFRGGQHAAFTSPRSCGTYTATGVFTPQSGGPAATPSGTVAIAGDCPDPNGFAPSVAVTTSPPQAGADTVVTTQIARPDRNARLKSMRVSLPPGLLGRLPGIPQCAVDRARLGDCGGDTRVGTVTALAGAGPAPLSVAGPVYLTPSIDGSFAGLAIVVPAAVGPLDLGSSVTIAKLFVRPGDQGLDVVVDDVPLRQKGIALNVRSLKLDLDRPGFTFNATNCAPLPVSATLGSDLGATAGSASTYQATGCGNLPFAPKIEATITGPRKEVDQNGHPGLDVVVTQARGEANSRSVAVTLPAGIAADPARLSKSCPLAQFETNTCPPGAKAGTARAVSSLLAGDLVGDAVFVRAPGSPLPQLRLNLRGQLPINLIGLVQIAKTGRLVNEFGGIPDVPLSRFELKLEGGKVGALQASEDLCTLKPTVDARFGAHSGQASTRTAPATVLACAPKAKLRVSSLRRGRPALKLQVDGAGKRVTKTRLKLPSGLVLDTKRARKLVRVQAVGLPKGTKATIRVFKTRLDVTFPKGGATRVAVTLRTRALRVGRKLRSRTAPRLAFRLDVSQPKVKVFRSNLRTRPVKRLS